MENQIKTFVNEAGQITVSSRSLLPFLPTRYQNISSQFTKYIQIRAHRLVLEEGKDYTVTRDFSNENGHKVIDYKLTLESAIKLAKSEKVPALVDYMNTLLTGSVTLKAPNDEEPVLININEPQPRVIDEVVQEVSIPTRPKSKAEQLLELAQSLAEEEARPIPIPDERLQALEFKVNMVLDHIWSLSNVLFGSTITSAIAYNGASDPDEVSQQIDATEPLPEIKANEGEGPIDPTTTRGKLHQLVNAYSASEKKSHRSVWTWLYKQLRRYYNFNVALERKTKTESYLDAADRGGHVDSLYYIAQITLIPTKSDEAKAAA